MFEEVGFSSVATSSAGLLISLGYQDDESIPRKEFMPSVRKIAIILSFPLSVDLVSGFGKIHKEVAASAGEVIEDVSVGINIEDFDHVKNELFNPEKQGEKIEAIKSRAETRVLQSTTLSTIFPALWAVIPETKASFAFIRG